MDAFRIAGLVVLSGALAASAGARPAFTESPGTLLGVTLEVDGVSAPLYPAPDGSGRFYVEARPGSRYSVDLTNRSGERLGVVLTVDGLNVVSGARDVGRGRMYVLDPWQSTSVRGWRTSLREVRQFTFVDEQASYSARVGRANEKMGWIELAVYRERGSNTWRWRHLDQSASPAPYDRGDGDESERGESDKRESAPNAGAEAPAAKSASRDSAQAPPASAAGAARSFPGTGWGRRAQDPVVLTSFDPEPAPSETLTLRYEYRPALVALGVLPRRAPYRDRLSERELGGGFAPPPRW
jgi:hypothetical protein